MKAPQRSRGAFQKVGECLYRYSSNGVYYARIKTHGKEIRRSLGTTDRALANRRLAAAQGRAGAKLIAQKAKSRWRNCADRYLETIQHQKPKTIERKTLIVNRIKARLADRIAHASRQDQTVRRSVVACPLRVWAGVAQSAFSVR